MEQCRSLSPQALPASPLHRVGHDSVRPPQFPPLAAASAGGYATSPAPIRFFSYGNSCLCPVHNPRGDFSGRSGAWVPWRLSAQRVARRLPQLMYAPPDFEGKICAPDALAARLAAAARPLVFTNGVFDILHRGHVTYLAQARALGARLLVALNSDASVRRLGKGLERPINTLADRLAVVAALAAVDLVTWFEEDTPLQLILAVRPEVLVKGGDWKPDAISGAREVLGWGGAVHSIPFEHERSTTALIQRLGGKR